jgi:hypothetical protein
MRRALRSCGLPGHIRIARTAISRLLPAALFLVGCAQVPNQWQEDGPATAAEWDSPSAKDVRASHAPAPQRHRDGEATPTAAQSGAVTHWPLYFEDPFEDKGHGRQGLNKYYIGWEDYVALPYCYSRFTLNWLMFPVSAVVTPPWTLMESDGAISRQALGYDHDATGAQPHAAGPAAAAEEADDEGESEPTEETPS